MVLDEQSQQLVKGLFARLDAVRCVYALRFPHTRKARAEAGYTSALSVARLTDPCPLHRMGTAC